MDAPLALDYNCGSVAQAFHADTDSLLKLLIGPVGTGKTTSAAYEKIMLRSQNIKPDRFGWRRSKVPVVRNTYEQLSKTTMKTIFEWFPPAVFGRYIENKKSYTIKFADKRVIELLFYGLDRPDDVDNLLSLDISEFWVDEARGVNQTIIEHLITRCGRFPFKKNYTPAQMKDKSFTPFQFRPQGILTTNYDSTENYLYKDFVERPKNGYAIFEQGQEENAHNLIPGYYDTLAETFRDRPDLLRTLVQGKWGVTIIGKAVYPEFNRKIHVSKEPLKPVGKQQILVGWDNTGLSPAIGLSYISPMGQWRLFKEFCFEDAGIADATEEMIVWCNMHLHKDCTFRHIGDRAGNTRDSSKKSPAYYIAEKAKDYGKSMKIEDGIQTLKIRLEAIRGRLTKMINRGEPAILIDPSMTRTIDGFEGGYAHKEVGNSGVYKVDPEKNKYSHIHDAWQYVATKVFKIADTIPEKPKVTARRLSPNSQSWMAM